MKIATKTYLNYKNSIKITKLKIAGTPGEERDKFAESLFKEVILEEFPNLGKVGHPSL